MKTIDQMKARQREIGRECRAIYRGITNDTPDAQAAREEMRFNALMTEHDELEAQIDEMRVALPDSRRPMGANMEVRCMEGGDDEHVRAFTSWLRAPRSETARAALTAQESRAATGLTGAAGGFVVPQEIAGPILSRARDANPLRDVVRVINVESGDIRLPLSNADASQGWVGETDPRNATTEPTLAGKIPTFGTSYAYVSMTEELAADGSIDVAQWLVNEAGAALGEAEMTAIVSGNGTDKPTGLLNTAPEAGADGSRTAGAFKYLPSGSTSAVDFDALISTLYDLRTQYRRNARWLMNSSTAGSVRTLKTSDGQYLWRDAMAEGQPPLLLGHPVTLVEGMPDIAEDAHPIAFEDFERAYVLCLRGGLAVQAADQSITTPGYNKLYIRERIGGIPYDENAARFIKCATS